MTDPAIPALPNWSLCDDLGGLVPSEIRTALRDYARAAILADRAAGRAAKVQGEAVPNEHAENILRSWLDDQHPDDVAVDAFASKMRVKMAAARAKGRSGWQDKADCPAERLSAMLHAHVEKGDPVDVANFCMMLSQRGESILAAANPSMKTIADLASVFDEGARQGAALAAPVAQAAVGASMLREAAQQALNTFSTLCSYTDSADLGPTVIEEIGDTCDQLRAALTIPRPEAPAVAPVAGEVKS